MTPWLINPLTIRLLHKLSLISWKIPTPIKFYSIFSDMAIIYHFQCCNISTQNCPAGGWTDGSAVKRLLFQRAWVQGLAHIWWFTTNYNSSPTPPSSGLCGYCMHAMHRQARANTHTQKIKPQKKKNKSNTHSLHYWYLPCRKLFWKNTLRYILFYFLRGRGGMNLLCSSGWHWTHDPPATAITRILGLQFLLLSI